MRMKKQIRFVCLLVLCAMLTGMLHPASASIRAERILKGMANLTPIPGTHLLIAQEADKNKWGLYDTEGNIVVPLEHEAITYLSYDFLSVASVLERENDRRTHIPLTEVNSRAIMTTDGTMCSEYAYGGFKVFSPLWFACLVYEEADKEDYDYTPDKTHFFRIEHCDIIFRGEEELTETEEELTEAVEETTEAVEESPEAEEEITKAVEESLEAGEETAEATEESTEAGEETTEAGEESTEAEEESTEYYQGPYRLVASLTRDEFKDAAAHGNYLSVQNREDAITVYSSNGDKFDTGAANIKSSMYGIKNLMVIDLATGEMVMDGCTSVSEIQTQDELLLQVSRTDFQGRRLNSLITTDGKDVIPMCFASFSAVSSGYVVITSSEDGKKGLYSRTENRMILPCVYDDIFENKNAIDHFNCHGYIAVMKDGQNYCYEVETSELLPVVDLELDEDTKLERYGATFYVTKKAAKTTTTQLISPDGNVKSLYCSLNKTRGSGYIMVARFSAGSTVINWYGNNYLPVYYSSIIMTDDDHFILNTKKSGYELYRIPE